VHKYNDKYIKALKLQEEGMVDEAETAFKKILKRNSKDFAALYSIGVIRFLKNDLAKSLEYFEKAKEVNPSFSQLHYNIGLVYTKTGRLADAQDSLKRAIVYDNSNHQAVGQLEIVESLIAKASSAPAAVPITTYSEALYKALELQSQNQTDEAERIFLHLLSENDKDFVSLYSMAVIEQHRGRPEKALEYVDRGVAAKSDYAPLWYSRGVIMQSLKQNDKAIENYDMALSINPQYIEAMINRGAVLVEIKRHKDALINYEELLKVDPNNDKALNNRGLILTDFKLYDIAVSTFEKLVQISPDYDYGLGHLAFAKMHACDWQGLDALRTQIIESIHEGKRVCKTQALLAMTGDPADHLRCARIFSQQHCPSQPPIWHGEIYKHRKIRIAYISPDFREHPVGHLTAGIFEYHDKEKFEIIAISLGIDDNSRLRQRMLAAFDKFIEVRQMTSRDVAAMLRSMEVDIAVDLAGYTADSRTDILAYRPVPLQVNFLGYSSTMGIGYIDYIIADRHIIPEEFRDCYNEKVVYMPDIYLPTDSAVQIAETTPPRKEYGLPDEGFIFCSFNHDYKISPEIFDVWMRLLKQVPGSVLWLMKLNESAERNLLKEASARGIEAERIVFATRVPKIEDHLARYRMADLFLDTTPYNAHTTTSDVLRAGLPVLTCRDKSFAGRVAAGLLTVVGLPELITDTLEEYESLALKLAHDKDMLRGIRDKLQKNLETTPLYDTKLYTHNLESAYTAMWDRYQKGEIPEHLSVSKINIEYSKASSSKISGPPEKLFAEITCKPVNTVAILIPVYKEKLDEFEQFAIDCLMKKAPDREKFFIAPRSLNKDYYRKRYATIEFSLFEDSYFKSIKSYNHLLLGSDFYNSFDAFNYVLIHQTDALMFHDNLDYWMERGFDYIGAPWPNGVEVKMQLGKFAVAGGLNLKAYVGNGGFSLRSVSGTIAVLQEFDDIRAHWIKSQSSEDLFFAYMGMVSDKFIIPNQMIASKFSLELEPEKYYEMNKEIPTGSHAGWRVYKEFWGKVAAINAN